MNMGSLKVSALDVVKRSLEMQNLIGINTEIDNHINMPGALSMITRDTIWVSNVNQNNCHEHQIKNLNNEHIANIIHFF